MSKFTADEAFEVQGTEDAIIINARTAARICDDHGSSFDEYVTDSAPDFRIDHIDAGHLLGWLGY